MPKGSRHGAHKSVRVDHLVAEFDTMVTRPRSSSHAVELGDEAAAGNLEGAQDRRRERQPDRRRRGVTAIALSSSIHEFEP
jgi:hypothetical protein